MSVVTENHTTQFNATLSPSHEDFLKKRELGGGFYQTEDIHEAGADAHSSHSGEMSRLLVWSTERSALVSRKELSAVAVSIRPATGYTTRQESRQADRDEDHSMTTSPIKLKRFLSIEETAEYTGLSVNTLYKMVSHRRIPFVKMGRLTKFDVELLDAWIKQNTVMPILPKIG